MGFDYQVVEFIENRQEVLHVPLVRKDVFQYRHQHGWYGWERRGLQKLCFWILTKLGAFYVEDIKQSKITRHVINPNKFMEKLYQQHRSLFQHFDCNADMVLIGAEDYAQLMEEAITLRHMFSFTWDYYRDRRIMGMKIHVIPWMRGILVVPKLKG